MSDTNFSDTNFNEPDHAKLSFRIDGDIREGAELIPLIKAAHRESYFADIPLEMDRYNIILEKLRDEPGYYGGTVALYEGKPLGFVFFMLRPLMGSAAVNVTVIHSIYLRADVRSTVLGAYIWDRLLTAARVWSIPRSSRGIMFNATLGIAMESADIAIRGAGGTYLGGNYFLRT